jgi:hypothetical protein
MEFVSQSAGFWVFVWVVRFSFSFETGLQARSFQSEGFGRDEEDSKIKQVSDRSVSSVRSCLRVFFFFLSFQALAGVGNWSDFFKSRFEFSLEQSHVCSFWRHRLQNH